MNQRAEFTWKDTDGGLLVSVRGEIDHHTAAAIRTGMDALLFARRPARLVLDLSAVTFMDSSGLGLIMGRYGILRELGGSMCVRDPSPEIRGILTLAGMERREAVIDACVTRLRPILMTSLTTILGLIVTAVAKNAGTALIQPIALVCIGGLLYATLMTLFVVPCMYEIMNRKELRKVNEDELQLVDM